MQKLPAARCYEMLAVGGKFVYSVARLANLISFVCANEACSSGLEGESRLRLALLTSVKCTKFNVNEQHRSSSKSTAVAQSDL